MYRGCWSGQKFVFGVCVAHLHRPLIPLARTQPFKTHLGNSMPLISSQDEILRHLSLVNVSMGLRSIGNNFRSTFCSFLYDTPYKGSTMRLSRGGQERRSCGVQRWVGCHLRCSTLHATHSITPAQNNAPNTGPKEVLPQFWRKNLQLGNITRVHRFPLLSNFERHSII